MQPQVGPCRVGNRTKVTCQGRFVEREGLCLLHALLFDTWIANHGGVDVYQDNRKTREEKRAKFIEWLRSLSAQFLRPFVGKTEV